MGNTRTGERERQKDRKRAEGEKRNLLWGQLSPEEKVNNLDNRLGVNKGASRQRAKLQS